MEELVNKIMETPSIKKAIADGEYSDEDIRHEIIDQLETRDVAFGVLMIDDLTDEVRQAICDFVKPRFSSRNEML